MEYTHKPVLLDACIQALNIRPDGIYVDGTLGRAGHSREIAGRLTTGRLICIDRDQAAIDAAQDRLAPWLDRVTLIHSNFSELKEVLSRCGVSGADGMLFDLGVSSPQLDDASRGFSYMQDAPLDMRMDTSAPLSAADIVNTWSQEELRRILWQYGEERYSGPIAAAIVRAREQAPIQTTGQLADLIRGMGAHVNLIPINPVDGSPYSATDAANVQRFQKKLESLGVNATVRRRLGSEISAACGQLRRDEMNGKA